MLKKQLLPIFLFGFLVTMGQDKDCLAFKGIGETYAKMRLDTKPELLFAYTSDAMRPYLKEKDMIVCYAHLTYLEDGFYILNLTFEFTIANALELYGSIPARSKIAFDFLDGNKTDLQNRTRSIGIFNEEAKTYRYKAEYSLSANQLKHLKIKELDHMSVNWSTGQETYELYDVDFFIRQFGCLAEYQ